jgi:site-specific DNA-cytosine methylase
VLYKRQAMPEKQRFPAVLVPAWQPCPCCEDFWCNIHHRHVYDCACAPIDDWAEKDMDPYSECVLRWITPVEAERLMGFPDGHTDVGQESSDAARYKALGNSMAVPVLEWIGRRIEMYRGAS